MLGFGWQEILFVLVLAIVVVGPERLPEMLRFLGKQYGKLRRASDELRRAFMLEADRADSSKRADELRKRRDEARRRADEIRKRALDARGGQPDLSGIDDAVSGAVASRVGGNGSPDDGEALEPTDPGVAVADEAPADGASGGAEEQPA